MLSTRVIKASTPTRLTAALAAALLCAGLSSCSNQPGSPPSPAPPSPVSLAGWKLTLPVAGPHGDAATVNPARFLPPWLTNGASGLTFWAPVNGVTTPHSEHTRTELVSLHNFRAGDDPHTLRATVSVSQVPTEGQDVTIGQIHGAAEISSVAFVMLHYDAGTIRVVVKQSQHGSNSNKYELISGVPLNAPFDYTIADNGTGDLTFTATYGGHTGTASVRVPDEFRNANVRFQAGAYQQADSKGPTRAAADGARVTFHSLGIDPVAQ